jgi:hypothetical protein
MAVDRTQLIYNDTSPGFPADFAVPPGLELTLASVVARWNGTAASGPFKACLALRSSDGKLIARVFPETEFEIGDTGVVTYAPFLRSTPASTPSGLTPWTYIRRETFTAQTVGNGAWVQVQINSGTTDNQDSARFGVGGGDPDTTTTKLAGRYGFKAQIHWDGGFTGIMGLRLVASGPWGWAPGISWEEPGGAAGDNATAPSFYIERDLPGGTSSFEMQVRQQSGGNQSLDSAALEIAYLGEYANSPNSDNF